MIQIHETAYPVLPAELEEAELRTVYTPSAAEIRFVFGQFRQAPTRVLILVQLKLLLRLGYMPVVSDVPPEIIDHVCAVLGARPLPRATLARYDRSGSKSRHQKILREYVRIQPVDRAVNDWLARVAAYAARTKAEMPDVINVMLEELVRRRFELPPLPTLSRIASHARSQLHEDIYRAFIESLDDAQKARLDDLFLVRGGRTFWDELKREPKRPGPREVASFLEHIQAMNALADGLPAAPDMLSVPKRMQFVVEARALDVHEMRALKPAKRYALAVLFVLAQRQKALDDVVEIFIKTVRNLENTGKLRLQQYQLAHADQLQSLVSQFRDVLNLLQDDETPAAVRIAQMRAALNDDPDAVLIRCNEHIAQAGNHIFPFLLIPYRNLRSLLFQCVESLSLKASSQDDALLKALDWLKVYRSSRREYLLLSDTDLEQLPLGWIPEKWERCVLPDGLSARLLHRKYFELCVFSQIMRELNSGDVYVEGSDQYDDPRVHQVSWDEFREELPRYRALVDYSVDSRTFVQQLKDELGTLADQVDAGFPENDHVEISEEHGLILHRLDKKPDPPNKSLIVQAMEATMRPLSILDILTETEQWLDLHRLFGPLSGFEAKIDEPRKRFITTLFCYGCNLGPTQTARSVKNLSRKQVAWLNLKYVTEERLDKAIVKVINAYNQFALPKFWGSGKRVSADGTKWNLYEQNLLSEYHIRYGGYGGIGYYHVSDKYIALFSHFIPCGVHEAVYILDGLIKNASEVQPDTVHGDTHAQSAPVFALAHLLGIKLMPRIRDIKDLTFFKADRRRRYKNIESLFRASIDWNLIERHFPDMLRVAISIKAGRMTPSTILRRLGSESVKNKLYFAFRELGRVIRTMFLLRYINDPEMRQTIHAATNKSEQFNDFSKWLMFGGEVIAENVRHEQRKVIKYNQLVANMVILYNVQWMSRRLKVLQEKGLPVDAEVLQALSPYRKDHINRLGSYLLDLQRRAPPLDASIDFSFESAA
ncbi:Tn3 family transposase [Burkholderia cenocepacia]|uniref:Tn3 family transposase n=1 Tax=Burkholderia cenocepacia TaxID=95486 RepID=A0ABD4ULF3_9BURK|nr:Tn3 family transposase [Burkholderia cenocepacia]MCW3698919.1 Tn3 family transposase [Burkholderia cenocepacia]MCW3706537.1 Tn3 family transposase [Burkholderia cenocepacia]MCW3714972.1 Tn3 family transposase [Burkholderia cenocepacia]MCW3722712.1 Tn3 family transposase [Burkholderia cenocepacia]MCW3729766.1 Tn3 family transposase [Burkholderia cenocepacia]